MTDLWADAFRKGSPHRSTPFTIAQEQALNLSKHTQSLVTAQLLPLSTKFDDEPTRKFAFILEASVLQFSFTLFEFSYPISGYPVFMRVDSGVATALGWGGQSLKATDELSFRAALGTIIRSEHTVQIVGSLMSEAAALTGLSLDDEDDEEGREAPKLT